MSGPDDPREPEGEEARALARLEELRSELLDLDEKLIRLLGTRLERVLEVGRIKAALGRPVLDPGREARVIRRAAEQARELGVDEELVRDVIWRIMAAAREVQTGRTHWGPPGTPEG